VLFFRGGLLTANNFVSKAFQFNLGLYEVCQDSRVAEESIDAIKGKPVF